MIGLAVVCGLPVGVGGVAGLGRETSQARMRSTKAFSLGLSALKQPFRHKTAGRNARSAALLVGSPPPSRTSRAPVRACGHRCRRRAPSTTGASSRAPRGPATPCAGQPSPPATWPDPRRPCSDTTLRRPSRRTRLPASPSRRSPRLARRTPSGSVSGGPNRFLGIGWKLGCNCRELRKMPL